MFVRSMGQRLHLSFIDAHAINQLYCRSKSPLIFLCKVTLVFKTSISETNISIVIIILRKKELLTRSYENCFFEQIAALHIPDQPVTMVDTRIQTTVGVANVPQALKHPTALQKSQPKVTLNMCPTSTLAVSIAIFN